MRGRVLRLGLALLVCGVWVALAEPVPVPMSVELPGGSLILDLDAAEVRVVTGAPAPTLAVRSAEEGRDGGKVELTLTGGGASLTRRAEEGAPTPPRLYVEIALPSAAGLGVYGSDLAVTVLEETEQAVETGAQPDEVRKAEIEARAQPAADGAILQIGVHASVVELNGVGATAIAAVASEVFLRGTHGSLQIDLAGGSVEVRGHEGAMALYAEPGDLTLNDVSGGIAAQVVGGSFVLRDGDGRCETTASDGFVLVDGWEGSATFTGVDSIFEGRNFHTPGATLEVIGEGGSVLTENIAGALKADLRGGALEAREIGGKTVVQADEGAETQFEGLTGNLVLTLSSGAESTVTNAARVRAQVREGRLEVDGAARLDVSAHGSVLVGQGVVKLAKLSVMDTEVELDLTAIDHSPSLELQGESRGRVVLPGPCLVRVVGFDAVGGNPVDVSGCELISFEQRPNRRALQRRYAGRETTLTATVGPDSELEVEGAG